MIHSILHNLCLHCLQWFTVLQHRSTEPSVWCCQALVLQYRTKGLVLRDLSRPSAHDIHSLLALRVGPVHRPIYKYHNWEHKIVHVKDIQYLAAESITSIPFLILVFSPHVK
jgi:hypothetical protein